MWGLGDYPDLGSLLEPYARILAVAAAVKPGMDVLDVAAGNGNFAIAAANAGANVTATDLTPKMVELGRLRTDAANLKVEWRVADAEALPFAEEAFDLVASVFGAMFAPRPARVGAELLRVVKPGGVVAMANYSKPGFLGSFADLSLLSGSVVIAALPEFVVGIGLLFLFAVELGWLPTDSATALTFASSFADEAKAYVLPAATLVLAIVPYVARIARGSLREALGMPYTQAAVLGGLSRRTVIWDHALRNAGVPLVNAVAINIVYLLSGVIVVEWVFAFPGVGQGLVQATSTSDAFNVEAIALLMGAMFIGVSLAADLGVAYLNPRLKAAAAR